MAKFIKHPQVMKAEDLCVGDVCTVNSINMRVSKIVDETVDFMVLSKKEFAKEMREIEFLERLAASCYNVARHKKIILINE